MSSVQSTDPALNRSDGDAAPAEPKPAPNGGRIRAAVVTALFAGLIIATGVLDVWRPHVFPRIDLTDASSLRFADGSWMRDFEAEAQRRSSVGVSLRSPYSAAIYGALGAVRLGLVRGKDGVLYFRERLEYRRGSTEAVAGPVVARLAAIERRFHERGSALITMLVPEKEFLLVDQLPDCERPRDDLYRRTVDELVSRGIPTPDLLTLLRGALQSGVRVATHTDTHWTGTGALMAIEAAAAAAGVSKPPAERTTRMAEVAQIPDCGDLLYFNGVRLEALLAGGVEVDLARSETPMTPFPVLRRVGPDGAPIPKPPLPAPPERLPLALVGTSFSIHEWLYDLGEMLSSATDLPVKAVTFQSIGPVWPLRILHGTTDPLPKTTIWEVPTSFAFSGRRALDGLDLLHTVMPPYRYDVAATAPAAAFPSRRFDAASGQEIKFALPPGRVLHEGRGAVFLRLVGSVASAPGGVFVSVDAGEPVEARWPEGHTEIFFPLLSPGTTTGASVRLYADPATVELERVEIVVDLAPKPTAVAVVAAATSNGAVRAQTATFAAPVASPARALVHLKFAADADGRGPLTVVLEAADGAKREIDFPEAAPDADVFVDPAPLGAPLARVTVRARGDASASLLKSVAIRPLFR